MLKSVIKNILPNNIVNDYRIFIWNLKNKFKLIFSSNSFLIKIYYAFFCSEFNREQKATIYGIKKKKLEKIDKYLVRRNIHRIEKGLSMKPRRAIFGEGFIKQTVDEFNKLTPLDDDQYNWYRDVLNEYFIVNGDSPIISPLRENFGKRFKSETFSNLKPYKRKDAPKISLTFDEILLLAKRRRSVRWYQQKKVPRELIEKALTVGLLSPSACNRQPFEFLVYDDKEKINKISSIPMGTVGFSQQFPMVIVVVGDLSAYDSERDRHVIYIDGSLCAMSFILALETLGLSSCMINWPDIEPLELRMDNELKLPIYKRPLFLISVGYADPEGIIPYSMKKNVKEIIKYNH